MGWVYFILLVFWIIWAICTNIGKIVTFLALTVCAIIAACFGLLALEWVIIGLARLITFLHDHGWAILVSVGGIIVAVTALCFYPNFDNRRIANRAATDSRSHEQPPI